MNDLHCSLNKYMSYYVATGYISVSSYSFRSMSVCQERHVWRIDRGIRL